MRISDLSSDVCSSDLLGMTQAAVSYQVKLLEERLGVPLFHREKRRVTLTDAGRRAAAPVSRAFDAIDGAFAGLRAEDESLRTISTSNTFANTWPAWRLGSSQVEIGRGAGRRRV